MWLHGAFWNGRRSITEEKDGQPSTTKAVVLVTPWELEVDRVPTKLKYPDVIMTSECKEFWKFLRLSTDFGVSGEACWSQQYNTDPKERALNRCLAGDWTIYALSAV